jgi:hypothetical protein
MRGLNLLVANIASSHQISLRLACQTSFGNVDSMQESGFEYSAYADVDLL